MNAVLIATVRKASVGKFYMIDFKRGKRSKSYAWIQTNHELATIGMVPPTDDEVLSIAADKEMSGVTGRATTLQIVRDGCVGLVAIKVGAK